MDSVDGDCLSKQLDFQELRLRSAFYKFDGKITYVKNSEMPTPLRRIHINAPKTNFLSYEYSDRTLTAISSEAEARLLAKILFYNLGRGNYGIVTFSGWMEHFGNLREAVKAWSLMFMNVRHNLKGIDESMFTDAVLDLFHQRTDLGGTLRDFENISQVIKRIIATSFWCILLISILLVSGISASTLLVTFSTIMISSAVAFGSTLKTIIDSLIFILYTKPYDVGDRIALQYPTAPPLLVTCIRVMTTTFVGLDNRVVVFE